MSTTVQILKSSHPHILVVGDLMVDHYLWGRCDRISPEAPVQVVDIQRESHSLGGAGNVICNLVALGATVSVASAIGDDAIGAELLEMLGAIGVDTRAVVMEPGRKTSKKSRIIASHQQVVRFDQESREFIAKTSEEMIKGAVEEVIERCDAVLLSDYGKGVLTPSLTQAIIKLSRSRNKKVLVDPKGIDFGKYSGATLVTPNKKEASQATGIDIVDDGSLHQAGFWLKNELSLDAAVITLSEDGMAIFDETMTKIPTVASEVYDVTGAGDTVLAALGFSLSLGLDLHEACRFANLAAAVVVGKLGSATATLEEIASYESSLRKSTGDEHIKSFEEISKIVQDLKKRGKKIVFTNGCFDILHLGHVKYLEVSKSFGDVLIVGLNSDDSVRRLKGENRPVNPEYDRAYLLAALEAVDYVVIFGEDTPYELIRIVRPDILVKGGDYAGKEVVGSDIAGEVRLVEFVEGKSTTKVIKKIMGK